MILDHLQTVFVHINKCGGTSVEEALGYRGVKHAWCQWYKDELGPERWARYFKFAVVRNPWARLVSMYHYRVRRQIRVEGRSFGEWLVSAEEEDRALHPGDSRADQRQRLMLAPQVEWIRSANGEVEMDHVARLETLDQEWPDLCRRIGVDVALPHANRSEHAHHSTYYDARARAWVEERYAEDIARWDYSFEGPTGS